jgi:hypothetical protein
MLQHCELHTCVYGLCVCQDGSRAIVEGWRERLERRGVSMVISGHDSAQPRGGECTNAGCLCEVSV